MPHAKLTAHAIIAEHPEVEGKVLMLRIDIACPDCGEYSLVVAGHHLRAIRNILIEMIDLHPDLTGEEAGMEVLSRFAIRGPGNDPSRS